MLFNYDCFFTRIEYTQWDDTWQWSHDGMRYHHSRLTMTFIHPCTSLLLHSAWATLTIISVSLFGGTRRFSTVTRSTFLCGVAVLPRNCMEICLDGLLNILHPRSITQLYFCPMDHLHLEIIGHYDTGFKGLTLYLAKWIGGVPVHCVWSGDPFTPTSVCPNHGTNWRPPLLFTARNHASCQTRETAAPVSIVNTVTMECIFPCTR